LIALPATLREARRRSSREGMSFGGAKKESNSPGRVIGLDMHPDSFTAAPSGEKISRAAVVEKFFNKVPVGQLQNWARKHLTVEDQTVREASGNSFATQRKLEALGYNAQVLESYQIGKLKEAHANNDKISAVRIGKAYLSRLKSNSAMPR